MNNLKKISFFLILICGNVSAIDYSNQSILVTRAPGKDAHLRELGWNEAKRHADDSCSCAFQVNGYYYRLTHKLDTGKYFGVKNKGKGITYEGEHLPQADLQSTHFVRNVIQNKFTFNSDVKNVPATPYTYVSPTHLTSTPALAAIASQYPRGVVVDGSAMPIATPLTEGPTNDSLVNYGIALEAWPKSAVGSKELSGELDFEVDRKIFGSLISFYVHTSCDYWLQLDIPIMQIKNKLVPKVKREQTLDDPYVNRNVSILDLLSGEYELGGGDPNSQNKLLYSQFSLTEQDKSGVGDPDITLGYRMVNLEKFDCDAFVRLSLPVADRIDPKKVFFPQLGNNGHAMLCAGVNGSFDFWTEDDFALEAVATCNFSYAIPRHQYRTVGSRTDRGVVLLWDRYTLLHQVGTTGPLEPAANILTTECRVSPGISTETMISLGFRGCNLLACAGCTLHTRQGEKVVVKAWKDAGKYGRPSTSAYRTDMKFDPSVFVFGEMDNSEITKSELEPFLASTPGSLTATFFAQVGYFNQDPNKQPFSANLGFSYEICSENSALTHYGIWGKIGMAF